MRSCVRLGERDERQSTSSTCPAHSKFVWSNPFAEPRCSCPLFPGGGDPFWAEILYLQCPPSEIHGFGSFLLSGSGARCDSTLFLEDILGMRMKNEEHEMHALVLRIPLSKCSDYTVCSSFLVGMENHGTVWKKMER